MNPHAKWMLTIRSDVARDMAAYGVTPTMIAERITAKVGPFSRRTVLHQLGRLQDGLPISTKFIVAMQGAITS